MAITSISSSYRINNIGYVTRGPLLVWESFRDMGLLLYAGIIGFRVEGLGLRVKCFGLRV